MRPTPPTNLVDFFRRFPSEKECAEYLFQIRWPQGFICPKCQTKGGYFLSERKITECSNPECKQQTSITAGTVLHRTKQNLHTWFWATYLFTSLTPSISAKQFQKQLGIKTYETAFCMLHKLRSALVAPGRDRLHGEVEVDEGYVGGKEEGCIGRGVEDKKIVIGAVELIRWTDSKSGRARVRCGRVRFQMIPNVQGKTLKKFVNAHVERNSKVNTDGWRGYSILSDDGYHHVPKTQSPGEESLPHFHRVFSNLKTWLQGTFHGNMSSKHLQAYLNEFTFRFNRRYIPGNAFDRALGLATELEGPTYKKLYKAGEEKGWIHPVGKPTKSGK